MELELNFSKSLDENAALYFEKSKESKNKIAGLKKALSIAEQKMKTREADDAKKKIIKEAQKEKANRKKKWFESFRWFISSDNLLIVGGRDAISNEQIVKNKMKKNDAYFHADVFGAPHCFIQAPEELKGNEFEFPPQSLIEASQFAATFSKAWEESRPQADVYNVKPEQVSKSAKSGESMGTGAFMIYGERNWFRKTALSCAIGYFPREKTLMCGPLSAIQKHCRVFVNLKQGSKSKEATAKELKVHFEKKGLSFTVDEFVSLLPNGNFEF
jgi:predicted ribosome quality control (RQC) complex YloA/Tae2 family protein